MAARPAGAAATADVLTAVAEEAVALLADDPREPLLLNLAGVALYEVGAVGAAQALFVAARRLDPELAHVTRNVEECKRRRKAGLSAPRGSRRRCSGDSAPSSRAPSASRLPPSLPRA